MIPILLIIALLIAAGLIVVGYAQRQKEAIFFGGIVLILLGIATITERVQYQTGSVVEYQYFLEPSCEQARTENSTCCCTFLNSTTESYTFNDTGDVTGVILGSVLFFIGMYFMLTAFFIKA